MCQTAAEAREHILGLLLGGCSPEEVEALIEGGPPCVLAPTALSDPTNVVMQEVTEDATRRG